VYEHHGRLHGGTPGQMRRAVVDAWWQASAAGEAVSMMAPTNAAVIALNTEAQRRRIDAGQLDAESISVGPYCLHVGDVVATRHNDRHLVTDCHRMVKNRDRWTVEALHRDGSLSVSGRTGAVRLPADYVAHHLQLAYAETSHANQGRTVDRSLLYLDAPTGTAGIYVPLTRGRESNEAFVVLADEQTPGEVVAESLSRHWIDRPAIAVRAERPQPDAPGDGDGRSKLEQPLDGADVRRLIERNVELERAMVTTRGELQVARHLVRSISDDIVKLRASISNDEKRLATARRTIADFDRPVLRRRHRVEVDGARAQLGWLPAEIERQRSLLSGLKAQEPDAAQRLADAKAAKETQPRYLAERAMVRFQLDQDSRVRGERIGVRPPAVVVKHLGSKPQHGASAHLWSNAAGRLAQHRAAFPQQSPALLGREPRMVEDDAYASSHRAATEAIERLGRNIGRHLEIEPLHRGLGRSL
ncbi:MAG: hypothetical protein ACRDZW_01880, partial [Acidimicrobiales bacterium]